MMDASEWVDGGFLATVAAEELGLAMAQLGIGFADLYGGGDGMVTVNFQGPADAESLLTLALSEDETPGSLYDRATSSCVTLASFVLSGETPSDDQLRAAIASGWKWNVHPAMSGRRMGWHVAVEMTAADANQLTANLNALRNGGVL
jgi:hypothetical protein